MGSLVDTWLAGVLISSALWGFLPVGGQFSFRLHGDWQAHSYKSLLTLNSSSEYCPGLITRMPSLPGSSPCLCSVWGAAGYSGGRGAALATTEASAVPAGVVWLALRLSSLDPGDEG